MSTRTPQIGDWIEGGRFRLPLADVNLQDKAVLLPLMDAAGVLELGDLAPATTEPDGAVTLSGRGQSHPFLGASVTLVLRATDDMLSLVLQATFKDQWHFAHSFPALAGSYVDRFPFASAKFSFPSLASGQEAGLWLEAPLAAPGERFRFLNLFDDFLPVMSGRIVALEGRFDFRLRHETRLPMDLPLIEHEAFTFGLVCHSAAPRPVPNGGKPIFIRGKQVSHRAPASPTPTHSGYFFLETTLAPRIGGTVLHIPLEARTHNPAHDITAIAYLAEASQFSLQALGEFLGKNIPLPGFLSKLNLQDYVALQALELQLSPWLPSKLSRIALHVITSQPIVLPIPSTDQSLFSIEDIGLNITFVNPLSKDNFDWLLHLQGSIRVGAQGLLQLATNFTHTDPAPVISGNLANGHPLMIGELIRHLSHYDGNSLPELEINQLQFQIDTQTGQSEFQIQMRDLWRISSGDKELVLQQLGVHIAHLPTEGLVIDLAAVLEFGGLRIELIAEHPGRSEAGWLFEGHLIDDEPLNLNFILAHLAQRTHFTQPPHLPDVFIREIDVTYHTHTRDFTFQALTEIDAPVGHLAALHFMAAQVAVTATHEADETTSIAVELAAKLQVGGQTLDVRTSLHTEEQVLFAQWSHDTDGLHVATLLQLLDGKHSEADTRQYGLDLTLRALALAYAHAEHSHDFRLTALTRQGWDLYVIGQWHNNWRFLLNLEFGRVIDAKDSLPEAIHDLLTAAHGLQLGRLNLSVATDDISVHGFPALPPLPGSPTPEPLAGASQRNYEKGLYLHLAVDLSSGPHQANSILPPHLVFSAGIQLQQKELLLEATLDGTFSLPGAEGKALQLDKVVFSLGLPDVALRLHGEAALALGRTDVRIRADLALNRSALQADLDVEFPAGGVQFMGIEGLYIDRLGGILGIAFPPTPGLEIGLFGTMHLGDEAAGADAVGILLLLEGEVPVPKLLELRIAHLDLGQLIARFLPEGGPRSPHALATSFDLSDLHLQWAAAATQLPDGRTIPAAFSFSAILDIVGWQAYADLNANAVSGINGIAVCSAFQIGNLLHVSGTSAGYTRKERLNAQGEWEKVSNTAVNVGNDEPERPERERVIVPPGGPEIIFSSQEDALLHLDLEISIFNFLRESVFATISGSKIAFQLAYEAGDVADLKLQFSLDKEQGFEAAADCHFRLGGEIDIHVGAVHFGKLNLTLAADAAISLGYRIKEQQFWLHIDFEADLYGWQIGPLRVRLDIAPRHLSELAGHMVAAVITHISERLSDLWEFLFHREKLLTDQSRSRAAAEREARAQADRDYLAAFQAHQSDLQAQAQRDLDSGMQAAQVIYARAQAQQALAAEQAAAYTALAADMRRAVLDRLMDIPPQDPHLNTRLAQIQTWGDAAQQRRSRKGKRAMPADRTEDILGRARANADSIQAQAQLFARDIDPHHG